jgi:ankyrin repeat protein
MQVTNQVIDQSICVVIETQVVAACYWLGRIVTWVVDEITATIQKVISCCTNLLKELETAVASMRDVLVTNALHLASKLGLSQVRADDDALVNSVNANGMTPLLSAVLRGNLEEAQALFGMGADINMKNSAGESALQIACMKGDLHIVQWLLENGAQIDSEDNRTDTPLIMACIRGHLSIAQALLAKGANINKKNGAGESPLCHACCYGHLGIVQLLLEKKALVDCETNEGITPLMGACDRGHLEIAQVLLAKGADVNKKNKAGLSALFLSCFKGDLNFVHLLLENKAQVDSESNGITSLIMACQKGHLEVARALLAKDANINKKDKNGASALYRACTMGHLSIVQLLLEKRAQVDCETNQGGTPLIVACQEGHLEIARALLVKGADVNNKATGLSALHVSCLKEDLNIVHLLLENKALVDCESSKGSTALIFASLRGDLGIVQALLAKGADVNKQSRIGETALSIAVEYNFLGIIKVLVEKTVKESQLLRFASGTTALHRLFANPNLLAPKILATLFLKLCPNFDVTCKNSTRHTPLSSLLAIQDKELLKIAEQILKEVFSGFGAVERVLSTYGVKDFLKYFTNHPDELIADPKNLASANPFTLALLFDDKELAFAIASKLNKKAFLKKCQELENTYPKTPVANFLYNAFIGFQSSSSVSPLPKGHIKALFEYLRVKIDVTQKSEAFETPLQQMLSSSDKSHPAAIIKELFNGFTAVQKRLSEHSLDSLLAYFIEKPEALLLYQKKLLKGNPLEIAFLFGNFALARAIVSKLTRKEFQKLGSQLKKRFPKSDVDEFLFNIEYKLNPEHLTKVLSGKVPLKPAGSSPDDFLKLFDAINFSDPNASLYVDPKGVGLGIIKTAVDLRKIIQDFVDKIKERKGIQGEHAEGSDARKEFYDTLENGICGIAHHLLSQPKSTKNDQQIIRAMCEFIKDVAYCGPKLRATTIRQYNNVVRKYDPTYDNLIFCKATDYRSLITDGILPNSAQSAHDYIKVVKACGKDFGLADAAGLSQFDDLYAGSGEGIDPEKLKKAFFATYTPYAILNKVINEIASDDEFREQYATWWQAHARANWQGDLADAFQEVKRLREKNTPNQEIAVYLESKDIFVERNEKPEDVLETVRRQNFVLQEVYENVAQNRFKTAYIIESLQKLNVIGRAVTFA